MALHFAFAAYVELFTSLYIFSNTFRMILARDLRVLQNDGYRIIIFIIINTACLLFVLYFIIIIILLWKNKLRKQQRNRRPTQFARDKH